MTLKELLSGVSTEFSSGENDTEIQGLTFDSRKVVAGGLFFALPGSQTDGNRYIRDALKRGAVAVVSELKPPPAPISLTRRDNPSLPVSWIQVEDVFAAMSEISASFYNDPSAEMAVIGVTGTNGKTTTTLLLESIISRSGSVPAVLGTTGHRLRQRTIERAVNTTPYSLDVQRLLHNFKKQGATHVAMEVSSHALATKRVESVHFDAAIMTNFHSDHLDFHKTREAYFDAKARLFELLERADAAKSKGVAVINRDDESYDLIRHRSYSVSLVSYGLNPKADYAAAGLASNANGTTFRVKRSSGGDLVLRTALIGRHNVYNALAAAAVALELGIQSEAVYEGLGAVGRVPGRLDPVDGEHDFSVLVDYAHTTEALASVLANLRELPHRKLISVFGCGGQRDRSKRGPMGKAACGASDVAIATSDNPRGEDPMQILRDVEQGIREGGFENYKIVPDRREAIYEAIRLAQKGDIVLIAGKGHEETQTLKDRTISFNDRAVAAEALKDLGRS